MRAKGGKEFFNGEYNLASVFWDPNQLNLFGLISTLSPATGYLVSHLGKK